jgi:hypothetical protein
MALWNRVKEELDRAGKAAQGALDEGKIRLEAFRARQLADKAAQALGYALYNARKAGGDLDADAYSRLSATLASHEADAARQEAALEELTRSRRTKGAGATPPAGDAGATGSSAITPYEPPREGPGAV